MGEWASGGVTVVVEGTARPDAAVLLVDDGQEHRVEVLVSVGPPAVGDRARSH
jgi:hypothetical protein